MFGWRWSAFIEKMHFAPLFRRYCPKAALINGCRGFACVEEGTEARWPAPGSLVLGFDCFFDLHCFSAQVLNLCWWLFHTEGAQLWTYSSCVFRRSSTQHANHDQSRESETVSIYIPVVARFSFLRGVLQIFNARLCPGTFQPAVLVIPIQQFYLLVSKWHQIPFLVEFSVSGAVIG